MAKEAKAEQDPVSKSVTTRLINPDPKKHSVKFDVDPSETKPALTGAYIMRNAFAGIGVDLATVKVIEVTVRVVE